jgi:hypothetical protein
MTTCTGRWMGNAWFRPYRWEALPAQPSKPVNEHERGIWEEELRCAIRAERRVALIGRHPFLALQPRSMQISGFTHMRENYPADPLHRPARSSPLSRALFDELHRLRRTLSADLSAFANLRDLQLSYQVIDVQLLRAIDRHPSLTELGFSHCWFPEATWPLTSVKRLNLHQIPGSHTVSSWASGYSMYEDVPDHHLVSAFNLISPAHLERLDVKLKVSDTSREFVLQQLCHTSKKLPFQKLDELALNVDLPTDLLLQLLNRTPTLRVLHIDGDTHPWTSGPISPQCIPLLENLTCPIDWARSIVPGRPVKVLAIAMESNTESLAATEADLDAFLAPLALSRGPISQLHLPPYPPLGPLCILMPCLRNRFPQLQGLKCAISGANAARHGPSYPSNCEIPWPDKEMDNYYVRAGDVEALAKKIRSEVETSLLPFPLTRPSSLSLEAARSRAFNRPTPLAPNGFRDRVKTYKRRFLALLNAHMKLITGRRGGAGKARGQPMVHSPSSLKHSNISLTTTTSTVPPFVVTLDEGSDLMADWEYTPLPPPLELGSSILFFDTYFGEIDPQSGLPQREPWHVSVSSFSYSLLPCWAANLLYQHFIYFLIRGYYRLPDLLETLELFPCFRWVLEDHYGPFSLECALANEDFEKSSRCRSELLSELSRRYPALSTITILDCGSQDYFIIREPSRRSYTRVRAAENIQEQGALWEAII